MTQQQTKTSPTDGQADQTQGAAPPPKNEPVSITQLKQAVCKKLTQIFSSKMMEERLMRMAGGDASRVAKNLTSFLSVIMQDDGGKEGNKKYYFQCSLNSLTMVFLESMNMQLPFDSRQLVSMIIYDWEVELDISYKGFVNALNKHYDNAYVDAKLVFKDDEFECEETGGKVVFRHKSANPFKTIDKNFTDIAGGYCFFTYTTKDGTPISRIVRMSRDDILKIKSKARTKMVWDDFPSEMGIKALIRRGSKIPFAAIDLDIDIEEVANRHFELEKPASMSRLENLMKAQEEVVNEKPSQPVGADEGGKGAAGQDNGQPGAAAGGDSGTPPPPQPAPAPSPAPVADNQPAPAGGVVMAPDEAEARSAAENEAAAVATISDADFEEVPPDPNYEPLGKIVQTGTARLKDGTGDEIAFAVVEVQSTWDGKTIFVGDKKTAVKDFSGPMQAFVYLKKVIGQRNTKASRKAILEGNSALIAALIKNGNGTVVAELHKLVDEGK